MKTRNSRPLTNFESLPKFYFWYLEFLVRSKKNLKKPLPRRKVTNRDILSFCNLYINPINPSVKSSNSKKRKKRKESISSNRISGTTMFRANLISLGRKKRSQKLDLNAILKVIMENSWLEVTLLKNLSHWSR